MIATKGTESKVICLKCGLKSRKFSIALLMEEFKAIVMEELELEEILQNWRPF